MNDGNANDESSPLISYPSWQPIATARMDGRLLLFNGHWTDTGYWDREAAGEGGQCWRVGDDERMEPPPTHWMPIPAPPEAG